MIEGDHEAQLAVRFSIFQLLIAAPRIDEHASIGAKTLSGFGYRHHVFWDTETFMLPFVHLHPARDRPEPADVPLARPGRRAATRPAATAIDGAQFPWESAGTGDEVTPTWVPDPADRTKLSASGPATSRSTSPPTSPYAVMQYWLATGDDAFMADHGAELILDRPGFWACRGRAGGRRPATTSATSSDPTSTTTTSTTTPTPTTSPPGTCGLRRRSPGGCRARTRNAGRSWSGSPDQSTRRADRWREVAGGSTCRSMPRRA